MHKAGQQPVEEEQQQLLYKKILEVSKYITNVESNLQIKSLPKKKPPTSLGSILQVMNVYLTNGRDW